MFQLSSSNRKCQAIFASLDNLQKTVVGCPIHKIVDEGTFGIMSQTLHKRPTKVRRLRGGRFSKQRSRNTHLEMSSLSAIASCNSMRQKVNRSAGRLQEVVIYVRFPSFYGGERRRPEIRLRWRAIKLIQWKNLGVLGQGVTYTKRSLTILSYKFLQVVLTSKSLPELKSVDQFSSAYVKIINKYI